jgi:hypothetical protein
MEHNTGKLLEIETKTSQNFLINSFPFQTAEIGSTSAINQTS